MAEGGIGMVRADRKRRWGRLACLVGVVALLPGCLDGWPGQSNDRQGRPSVAVHVSAATGDRLASKPSLRFGPKTNPEDRALFVLDDSVEHQKIDGFGASFLEAGLVALNTLPRRSDQDAVLRALFNRDGGAGFSAMKTPIGATDFMSASPKYATYDDTPGDTSLAHFSIARDLGPNGLVTYIKRARKAGGQFILQAPMDYPPDWMLNDVVADQDVNRAYFQVLANYYVKYVRAYERNGIHVDYVSLFNEPGNYTKIDYGGIRDLIRDYVGPTFRREGLTTRIQLSEDGGRTGAATNYPTVLDDPQARQYVAGLPYHGYDWTGWDRIADLHRRYPDIPIWMTELCCYYTQAAGARFEAGDFWGNQIISDLEAGASAWIYWNAILDETGGQSLVSPIHGDPEANSQNSVVVIDRAKHTVTYTGLYYYLAHFSKFVRPGARRIQTTHASSEDWLRAVSFRNADGTLVTELVNSAEDPAQVQVDWHGLSLTLTLPEVSITTLEWRP